jgi:cell division protein FtsB
MSTVGIRATTIARRRRMAKALLGHLPGSDPRTAAENAALRRRVADLQDHVARLEDELTVLRSQAVEASHVLDLDDELRTLDAAHAASTV